MSASSIFVSLSRALLGFRALLVGVGAAMTIAACDGGSSDEPAVIWQVPMGAGFEGSPTVCDLDHDGQLEVVVPIAVPERPDLSSLMAINGRTGTVTWETPPGNVSYAYPFCVDVNDDGVDDLLVGGRTADVRAISGLDGSLLGSLSASNSSVFPSNPGNTNSVVASDDQATVLFVSTRGDRDLPDSPGTVLAFNRELDLLAVWEEPAGREIYSSPAVARSSGSLITLAVGSGGELNRGVLHIIRFDTESNTFSVVSEVSSPDCALGFVSSPMVGDVTGTGAQEVVAVDDCGTVHVADLSGAVIWTHRDTPLFGTANPLLADVSGDGRLDVVVALESLNFSLPETLEDISSKVVALRGTTGAVLWSATAEGLVVASPVSVDFDGDSIEDVIVAVARLSLTTPEVIPGETRILSGATGALLHVLPLGNTSATPVVADIRGSGATELLLLDSGYYPSEMPGWISLIHLTRTAFDSEASFSGFRGIVNHSGRRD